MLYTYELVPGATAAAVMNELDNSPNKINFQSQNLTQEAKWIQKAKWRTGQYVLNNGSLRIQNLIHKDKWLSIASCVLKKARWRTAAQQVERTKVPPEDRRSGRRWHGCRLSDDRCQTRGCCDCASRDPDLKLHSDRTHLVPPLP